MSNNNFKIENFLFTLGICAMIAAVVLMILGNWEGIPVLSSGALLSYLGFRKSKASKNV